MSTIWPLAPTAYTVHQLRKIMNTVSQCEKKIKITEVLLQHHQKIKKYLSDITVHTVTDSVRVKINKKGNVKDS